MTDLHLGLDLLLGQSGQSLMVIFWYTLLFEIPRYGFPVLAVALEPMAVRLVPPRTLCSSLPIGCGNTCTRVSVIVVGHNEADALETCVSSLREQSYSNFEIVIVSDGSNDGMGRIAARLVREGQADRALATELRGGKSAALNLALGASNGDIVITVDCDCSYDRYAIAEILRHFADPSVAAVCGDIVPRNGDASLVACFQWIEYMLTISMGKRIGAAFDQVVCLSGAFSAFRREALEAIGGFDVGGGEDLDITLRLRARGWRIGFAAEAICYTDVPVQLWTLLRQRLRWERDAVRLRYRKHRDLMLPNRSRFLLAEALHQWEFLLFSVVGAIAFPFYIAWLYATYGGFATSILIAAQLGLLVLDAAMFALAAAVTGRTVFWGYLLYLPGFSVFTSYVMRLVRFWAYVEEWTLFASTRDNYVPTRVRQIRKW